METQLKKRSSKRVGFSRNARLFFKSKIGVVGFAVIMFFVVIAILAPILTSNDPVFDYNVSSPYSVPQWATVFPRYQDLPVTSYPVMANSFSSQSDASAWKMAGPDFTATVAPTVNPTGNFSKYRGSLLINASIVPAEEAPPDTYLPGGQLFFSMSQTFNYTTKPPNTFVVSAFLEPIEMQNISLVYVNYIITSPVKNFSLSTAQTYTLKTQVVLTPSRLRTWFNSTLPSGLLPISGLPGFANKANPGSLVFSTDGTYRFTLQLLGVPSGSNPRIAMYATGINLHVLGLAYGLLGTDIQGRDLWSQFVWGSRVSLLIGILSALGAVGVGTVVGLSAGYLGGWFDEVVGRVTDFFLVIPFLPFLIIVILLIGQDPLLYKSIYDWIILLFTILSWPTIARIIRGQVLTVKTRPYVEASRALGGSTSHIIGKHILPNVMGLVYSQAALNVSGFILLEAALDFLAVSLHPINVITWGQMLTFALNDALVNSTVDYAWWWFFPPGIAIAALSLAFVLVGFALDRVFNPKLRAR